MEIGKDFTIEILHFSGGKHDTKHHCQVCDARLPRRNHSARKRELCQGHNSAVNMLVYWHKVSVEQAVQMVKARFKHGLS
jgi:hypothetical protein